MPHPELTPQILDIPSPLFVAPEVLPTNTRNAVASPGVTAVSATPAVPEITTGPIRPEATRPFRQTLARIAARVAVGVALTGTAVFGVASRAEAAPPTGVSAEAPSRGSGIDLGEIFTGLGLGVAAWSLRNQTREKTADRLHAALQNIKGESTGEERLARLNAIEPFATRRKSAPEVFAASVAYLRGRRGGLLKLRRQHADNPEALEEAITDRRNADRGAFRLFLETLPTARRQVQRQNAVRHILGSVGITYRNRDEAELKSLDELTDLQVDTEKPRVNARGINLDDMRGEVQNCNLRGVDLTGAGLQRNDIKRVSFREARVCEAQLEGSKVSHCGLQGADFRAAYFGDTDYTVFEKCVVDANTQFGNLPDRHPNARVGKLDPARAEEYRGTPNVILKDLRSATLSRDEIIALVHEWQRNGLVLQPGSDEEYFLPPQQ